MIVLLSFFTWAQDDEAIEDKWHEIYSQYYNKSLTQEEWSQIAGEKINETYTIQKGDTLWDISTTLFGNGYYWPKIWQLNSDITNPHSIHSNYEIHFQPGTTDAPPEIKIVEKKGNSKEPKPVNIRAGINQGTNELTAVPIIPPPTFKSRPVIEKIPPSLPTLVARKQDNNYDRHGFSLDFKEMKFDKDTIVLSSYLTNTEPETVGRIVEAEGNHTQASIYQYVYVKLDKGEIGQRYTSYKVGKKLVDPTGQTKVSGIPIYIEGELEVTEEVNKDDHIFKAMVTKSIAPVHVGNHVVEGKLGRVDLTPTQDFVKIPAKVVGGELENSRFNLGYYSLVYFNIGSDEGVKLGQMIHIFKNERLRKESLSTEVKEEEDEIGLAKIVNVTAQYSTGIILRASKEIKIGDYAGDHSVIKEDEMVGTNEIEDEVGEEAKGLKQAPSEENSDEDSDLELDNEDTLE